MLINIRKIPIQISLTAENHDFVAGIGSARRKNDMVNTNTIYIYIDLEISN